MKKISSETARRKSPRTLRGFDVAGYWNKRYKSGRHSGDGSRGEHANYKAEIIIQLIQSQNLKRVYDLGCGDMFIMKAVRQRLPDIEYTGVDISQEIVKRNREQYTWGTFETVEPGAPIVGAYDLVICYDVLFHLPKPIFDTTLKILRDAEAPWVILSAWRKPMPKMSQHVFFNEFNPTSIGMVVGRDYLDDYRTSFTLLKERS